MSAKVTSKTGTVRLTDEQIAQIHEIASRMNVTFSAVLRALTTAKLAENPDPQALRPYLGRHLAAG